MWDISLVYFRKILKLLSVQIWVRTHNVTSI